MTYGPWCSLGLQCLPNNVILGVDPPLAWAQRSSQFSNIPVFFGHSAAVLVSECKKDLGLVAA